MRWFNRNKESEEENEDSPLETKPDKVDLSIEETEENIEKLEEGNDETINEETIEEVKTHEEVLAEQYQTEVQKLEEEIKTKTENLESISKKFDSVKGEYDIAVTNLMKTKKELNEKKLELESVQKEHEGILEKIGSAKTQLVNAESIYNEKKKKTDELEEADATLADVKAEIEENKKEYELLKKHVIESQSILDQITIKKNEVDTELQNTNTRLENARKELQKIQSHSINEIKTEQPKQEVEFIEKELSTSNEEQKNVVEAASVVVASMNQKLRIAEKELEVVKKLLDKERTAHLETKKELDKLKQSQNSEE